MNENDSLLPQKEWEKKSDNESTLMITPSDIIEWAFCPRFVYYMHTLQLSQHEELRFKVLLGRKFHEEKENRNRPYLRKKIDCIKKEINVYLALPKLRVRGIVDEVLHFSDGFIAPLDYKLTKFRESIFTTHRYQLTLYAMLMREIYHKPVYKGYLVYVDGRSELKEIFFEESDFREMEQILDEVFEIIQLGYFPKATRNKQKCIDCCYRNICIQ